MEMIQFNRPYITGDEIGYIGEAIAREKLAGNGTFTKQCQKQIADSLGSHKVLLTTSCTDALEMCAILVDISPGDEVILPSFTFVSTALAFIRQGAKVIFVDSRADHPGIDESDIERRITDRTKAIVVVHYAGVACDMDAIMRLANERNLVVIEDAAQAIDSYYREQPLGGIGHLAAVSFHETKNIGCGEGGALVVNDEQYIKRAEIVWEKGTDRAKFFRGEIDKYGWVDIGSSFLPSELVAAFLYAQLEHVERIQTKRKAVWQTYDEQLRGRVDREDSECLPVIPDYATNNAHMYYIKCESLKERTELMQYLKRDNIQTAFHYASLHDSPYYKDKYDGLQLPHSDRYSNTLLRLPLHCYLTTKQVRYISEKVRNFFNG